MRIEGLLKYDFCWWSFEIERVQSNNTYIGYRLKFTDDKVEFEYNFNDLKELYDQYKKQETNLFKEFFNDYTIDYNSLDFEIDYIDESNVMKQIDSYHGYYVEHCIENDPDYIHECRNDIKNYICDLTLNFELEQRKFSNYFKILLFFATGKVRAETAFKIYENYEFWLEQYSIYDIKELNKEGSLKILEKLNGFTDKEKNYIEYALNY